MLAYGLNIATFASALVFAGVSQAAPTLQTIYSFKEGADGQFPSGALAVKKDGTISGTTGRGGGNDFGTVFVLTPQGQTAWSAAVVADFANKSNGKYPMGGVISIGNSLLARPIPAALPSAAPCSGCRTAIKAGPSTDYRVSAARTQAMAVGRAAL